MGLFRAVICITFALAACDVSDIDPQCPDGRGDAGNPTGSCEAPNDGSRQCWSVNLCDRWLPDCGSSDRSYWRIFAKASARAYIFPRPDGTPQMQNACTNADENLRGILDRYTLCGMVDVNEVNDMQVTHAFEIVSYLRGNLSFVAQEVGMSWQISPIVGFDDILAVCRGDAPPFPLTQLCGEVIQHDDDGTCPQMARPLSQQEAQSLAAAANALYGI